MTREEKILDRIGAWLRTVVRLIGEIKAKEYL